MFELNLLQALFNAAAQSWNHAFYWKCMTPNGGGHPSGDLFEQIVKDFGSYDEFSELFLATGNTVFGSGWAWLSTDKSGSLYIQAENGTFEASKIPPRKVYSI